jgi:hypothetical protein
MGRTTPRTKLVALALMTLALSAIAPASASAAVQWISPLTLSDSGQNAYTPQVAAAPNGDTVAIWVRDDGTALPNCCSLVQAAVRLHGNASFSPVQTLSAAGQNGYEPQIAMDAAGNAVAVWTRYDGQHTRIQSAVRAGGGSSFGAVSTLSVANKDSYSPDVAVDPNGEAYAVWIRAEAKPRVEAAVRPGGGSFGAEQTISDPTIYSDEPHIDVDGGGVATAVWTAYPSSNGVIQSSRRVTFSGYVRAKGAQTSLTKLVPAFEPCSAANSTHGAPLASPSCNPPSQSSGVLTVGTPDANGAAANATASLKLEVVGESPIDTTNDDQADVVISFNAVDVRCRTTNAACPNGSGSDFAGTVLARVVARITDQDNGTGSGTVQDLPYLIPVPCTATTATTIGGTCSLLTSADALIPNSIKENRRSNWELQQVEVRDPGPNGSGFGAGCPQTCGDGDEATYLRQGIFIP